MKRALAIATGLAALVAVFGFYRPRCAFKGHNVERQPHLNAWRCLSCGSGFVDLGEAIGDPWGGYVSAERVEALNRDGRVH